MVDTSLVLVDASVWIRAFHAPRSQEADLLDGLLAIKMVATCAPIQAEVVSGAQTAQAFHQLRSRFSALARLELPSELWFHLEEHRFALARRGHQASLIDLMIAVTSQTHHVPLWTLDKGFQSIASIIPLHFYRAEAAAQ